MDFELVAADAHSPDNAEQWISHSTPLVPVARKMQKNRFRNRLSRRPETRKSGTMDFEIGAAGAHILGNNVIIDAAGAHSQGNADQMISKSRPLVPYPWKCKSTNSKSAPLARMTQRMQKHGFRNRCRRCP
jgi:hypothetical protein